MPRNWYSPTDWVSRESSTGGSHADARVMAPPRFGGLVLAGIHSGYVAGAANTRVRVALTARAVNPAPASPVRLRNSRRFTRSAGALWLRPSVGILALLFCLSAPQKATRPADLGCAGARNGRGWRQPCLVAARKSRKS